MVVVNGGIWSSIELHRVKTRGNTASKVHTVIQYGPHKISDDAEEPTRVDEGWRRW